MNRPDRGEAGSGGRDRYPEDRPRAATIRSRLMLEVASELVSRDDFGPKQVRVSFREQGADTWEPAMFGSDALSATFEVASGETDFAIINPATMIGKAVRGAPPFKEPVPVRAVATVPSYDQLGVAIRSDVDIDSWEQLVSERPALRVSLRGERPDHSIHAVTDDVVTAVGTSLEAMRSWGGEILYQSGIPDRGLRSEAIRHRQVDMIIDEGIYNWVDLAIEAGYRFLSVPGDARSRLESMGYRLSTIAATDYRLLTEDVATIDFSGFLIYTHERVSDELVTAFCESLDARRDRIPWQGGSHLPLHRMVTDEADAPIPIAFHPAAERYWAIRGYLGR